MALVKLGQKYRVFYESSKRDSGISNITATIKRPDGVKVGPLSLTEEILPEFFGTYSVEYTIPTNAPLGEWTGIVESPEEGVKSGFRFSVESDSSSSGVIESSEDEVDLVIDESPVFINVEELSSVDLEIDNKEAVLTVEKDQEIDLIIPSNDIILKTDIDEIVFNVDCEEI